MRILIIEDEPSLLKSISRRLREEGYSVDTAEDGEDGQELIEVVEYDCIILDIMLPVINGLAVLKHIRNKGIKIPVLLLTAKDAIEDKVKGLDLGADDYLTKPFSFDELLARIRALLRRQNESKETTLKAVDLILDTVSHTVSRGGNDIELTAKEYAILEYMLRNKGRLLTRSQIADHVWNYDFEGNSNIVDVYIRYLRKKIDDDFDSKLLHTVRGSGYMLKEKI